MSQEVNSIRLMVLPSCQGYSWDFLFFKYFFLIQPVSLFPNVQIMKTHILKSIMKHFYLHTTVSHASQRKPCHKAQWKESL